MKNCSILISGGSGLLGKNLSFSDHTMISPSHSEMDITDRDAIEQAILKYKPDVFLHLAALTSPPKVNSDPAKAVEANILGTTNIVLACMAHGIRLVYISTDYVFKGDRGMYSEEDELLPQNKYAWSKLGGECAARLYDNSLIIRTSFVQNEFPYEKAFVDQYTSRDTVNVIAPIIAKLTLSELCGVIHVGTERKSVFEMAKTLREDVGELRRDEVNFIVPYDTSFNINKLKQQNL